MFKTVKINRIHKVVSNRRVAPEINYNFFKFNQVPEETPDGVNVTFTLPNDDRYASGLIEVFVNGNKKIKDVEWEEGSSTQIVFIGSMATNPPTSTETIVFNYILINPTSVPSNAMLDENGDPMLDENGDYMLEE